MKPQCRPRRAHRTSFSAALAVATVALILVSHPAAWAAAPATAPATQPVGAAGAKPDTRPAEAEPAKPPRRPAPEAFLRNQRQQRDASGNFSNIATRDGGACRLDSLLQFRMVKGALEVDTAAVPAGQQVRMKVEGSNATWLIYRQPQNFNAFFPGPFNLVAPTTTTVTRIDPDVKDDNEVWSTYINVSGGNFWVMGQCVLGRVMYNQTNGQINVNAMEWTSAAGNNGQIQSDVLLNAHAGSLGQLRGDHPEEFRKYVLPLLAKLSDLQWMRPGAADVYAAFGQVPADEQVTARVRALLPDLDSDAFPVRDAASTQLAALGPPAVLAALRMDWSELSDEQRGRVLSLVNEHRRREYADAAAAKHDTNFLADCLEYDDPAVRSAARAALEQALGQKVVFDAALSGAARESAVDAIRKQIAQTPAATQPTTRPASGEAEPAVRQ